MKTKAKGDAQDARRSDQPCDDCPWRRKNQTAKAVAASPVDARGVHWFSKANLERHWRAAGDVGAMLPCHKTDVNAPFYGGQAAKAQDARICVGLSMLARREVTAFMKVGQNYDRYAALNGLRWSAVGLAAWAARLYHAGAVFALGDRRFTMPTVEPHEDDAAIGVPWSQV